MAKTGDIIDNPITGERLIVDQTTQDTNGEVFSGNWLVKPHGFVAASHIHPKLVETFTVTSGTIHFRIDGKESDAGVGEVVSVPPGTLHSWWNATDEEVSTHIAFRPALDSEVFFETFYGLARDGKTDKRGLPNILQTSVIASAYQNSMQLPLPSPVKILLKALEPLARLLGYRASYPQYSNNLPNIKTEKTVSQSSPTT